MTAKLTAGEIRDSLSRLEPTIPWAHHFDLGHGIETVSPSNEQFYRKSVGLKKLASMVVEMAPHHTRRGSLKGARVLDLACAEGAHSIALAAQGAEVVGIEGRELYVRRAELVARALGMDSVQYRLGDIRKLKPSELGRFDLVLCSGVLHHLGQNDFDDMIKLLAGLTADAMFLYTHISALESITRFRLRGPVTTTAGYEGYLFREHEDDASAQERIQQVRASLDNTFSFWATEESLVRALHDAGFESITKFLHPHIFGWEEARIRPIVVARMRAAA